MLHVATFAWPFFLLLAIFTSLCLACLLLLLPLGCRLSKQQTTPNTRGCPSNMNELRAIKIMISAAIVYSYVFVVFLFFFVFGHKKYNSCARCLLVCDCEPMSLWSTSYIYIGEHRCRAINTGLSWRCHPTRYTQYDCVCVWLCQVNYLRVPSCASHK